MLRRPAIQSGHLLAASILLSMVLVVFPVRAQPAPVNQVGINTHLPSPDMLDAVVDLGLGWIRIDVNWFQGEPRQGRYEWGHLDPVVNGARQRGLQVFMTIAYTPEWASSGNRDPETDHGNDVPRAGLYEQYVQAVVERYRDRVTHYGIWNEPNLDGFFEGSIDEYIDLILTPGAAAVRAACGGCQVLGPDLAGIRDWQDYLGEVLTRAGDQFDILTHHTYTDFQESHGSVMWLCDDFPHAMESSTDWVCFYKKGLREVMTEAGHPPEALPVWMTEVGYRVEPQGHPEKEQRQAIHVRRLLEEQLERAWWQNTFFYELMDCECGEGGPAWGCMPAGTCSIDGYGVVRRIAAPDATWADNFRLKPSYHAIKQFVADHDEFRGGPSPHCADGQDNDGDRLADLLDPGCQDAGDDDESDDPPRAVYEAPGILTPPTIDGRLGEWPADRYARLAPEDWVELQPGYMGPADLSARFAMLWTPDDLYLAVEVTDDQHTNGAQAPGDLWQGDSVQVAFDPRRDGGSSYGPDDLELGFALLGQSTARWRWTGPPGAGVPAAELQVERSGTLTRYEIRLPADQLPGLELALANRAGFSLLVNDDDGQGREGWLEWTPGIGRQKLPAAFGELQLGRPLPGEGEGEEGEGEGSVEGEGEEGEGEEGEGEEGEGEEGEGDEGEGEEGEGEEGEGEEGEGEEGEGEEGEGEEGEGEEGEGDEGEGMGGEGAAQEHEGDGSPATDEIGGGGCHQALPAGNGTAGMALLLLLALLIHRAR